MTGRRLTAALLALGLSACHTPAPPPLQTLEAPRRAALRPPDEADMASKQLAISVLTNCATDPQPAIARIEQFDADRARSGQPPSGLLPHAIDASLSCIEDDLAYQDALASLRKMKEVDDYHRARLDQEVSDDPLRLANKRLLEDKVEHYGGVYNQLVGPLGRTVMSGGIMAPISLTSALGSLFGKERERDELSVRQRQALVHWQEFLDAHPDAPESAEIAKRVARYEERYEEFLLEEHLEDAKIALARRQFPIAARHTAAALRIDPASEEALELQNLADKLQEVRSSALQASVSSGSPLSIAAAGPEEPGGAARFEPYAGGSTDSARTETRVASGGGGADREPLFAATGLALVPDPTQTLQEPSIAAHLREIQRNSEQANLRRSGTEAMYGEMRETSAALLLGEFPSAARAKRDPLQDEMAFIAGMSLSSNGEEDQSFATYRKLARSKGSKSNMGRHAAALVNEPKRNPYDFFKKTKSRDDWQRTRWVMLGQLANGPRKRGLWRPIEWVLDTPALIGSVAGFPTRAVKYPSMSPWPFGREPSMHARNYLERFPEGENHDEVLAWLQGYEKRRGNHVGTLEIARRRGEIPPKKLAKMEEKAAEQMFEAAKEEDRRDLRLAMLKRTAMEFPDTETGKEAGMEVRRLWSDAAPQHIRITRGFLEEHPELAGPRGVGLEPTLLDEDNRNGELHPEGITLLGGDMIQIAYVDHHGDKEEPPQHAYERLPAEQLSRLVALLEEASFEKARLDRDYEHQPDAKRDQFFERARLGLTSTPDARPSAESSFVFEGVREKYGLVRGRDSILPVDMVLQGSLYDLSLNAFPRIRMPKETPDSVLYR